MFTYCIKSSLQVPGFSWFHPFTSPISYFYVVHNQSQSFLQHRHKNHLSLCVKGSSVSNITGASRERILSKELLRA